MHLWVLCLKDCKKANCVRISFEINTIAHKNKHFFVFFITRRIIGNIKDCLFIVLGYLPFKDLVWNKIDSNV